MEKDNKKPNVLDHLISEEGDKELKDFNIYESTMSEEDMQEFFNLLSEGDREEAHVLVENLASVYQDISDKVQQALEDQEVCRLVAEELDKKLS